MKDTDKSVGKKRLHLYAIFRPAVAFKGGCSNVRHAFLFDKNTESVHSFLYERQAKVLHPKALRRKEDTCFQNVLDTNPSAPLFDLRGGSCSKGP